LKYRDNELKKISLAQRMKPANRANILVVRYKKRRVKFNCSNSRTHYSAGL